jgi:hypothetical protein
VRASYDGDVALQQCHRRDTEFVATHRQKLQAAARQQQAAGRHGSSFAALFGSQQQEQEEQEQGSVALYSSTWGPCPGELVLELERVLDQRQAKELRALQACSRLQGPSIDELRQAYIESG